MKSQDIKTAFQDFFQLQNSTKAHGKNKMLLGFPFLFLFFSLLTEQNPKQILKIKI